MKLFSGSSNPKLAKDIAQNLDLELSKAEVLRFGNSEVRVRIEDDVKNEVCVVVQPTSRPTDTNLMELFFFCDALKRQEARKVIGVVPFFGYARQDIQHREGECVSANVVIRFLESIGFDKIYTVDLHNEATEGAFSIPFKNLSAMPLLAEAVKKYLENEVDEVTPKHVSVLIPDYGAIEQGRAFGEALFGIEDYPMAVVEKHRDPDTGAVESFGLYGDVDGKVVVMVDDMIVSGGTILSALEAGKKQGAKKFIAAMSHRDFTKSAPQRLQDSEIDAFFATDSIAVDTADRVEKLQEVSLGKLLADELSYLKEM